MGKIITGNDCQTFEKYRGPGAEPWTAMSEADKALYRKVHQRLEQIVGEVLAADGLGEALDTCVTLGFSPSSGVRGSRPKDLWCAVFPRGAPGYVPQVYLIVSYQGAELGFAASVHPSDFSNQNFKQKLRQLAPLLFDQLPSPYTEAIRDLVDRLAASGRWHYRRKSRMEPNGDNFPDLAGLLAFLKGSIRVGC